MKEKALNLFKLIKEKWQGTTKKQKSWMIGSLLFVIILSIVLSMLMSAKHYTPLYSNLSADEAGQIKETLDSKKIPYKLSNGGSTISVPKEEVDRLKVELAAEGIPKSGEIDYSFFGKNASFGMTDKEFDVLERAAMQTELAHLITQTKGVKSAKVMINLPDSNVWVGQDADATKASASIVLNLNPGYQLSNSQVQGLYHLVSKSVPNLPEDNIVITDQYFNYYDKTSDGTSGDGSTLAQYDQQRQIKQDIERGIQQKVSQMLGMMMGNDKVVVNVSTALDFTQQKSTENLAEPVDKQTMEGLQVSSEKITETYSGNGAGGQVGTGNQDVATYQGNTNSNGNYKKVEERINNEFNRIHRTIVNSPYTIKDIGIQVMVEPPKPNQPTSLSAQSVNDVKEILNTIIKTSLTNSQGAELDPATISQKSVVSVGKFNGKTANTNPAPKQSHLWFYIAGGILLAVIILLIILLLRKRNEVQEDDGNDQPLSNSKVANLEEAIESETPEKNKYRQLEQMANQNPTEFVKLLRSWLSED
ncbi:flagellar basal body M-ring protein FliF [Terrilactibacillus sp. BCM23-1]|uniref:Flagellar M-ring protein n=1 Tax=Terrilactibacillus tamarindi TaxID=2599694 RepID=A0A6N8CQ72_9BACI|nr:flagellar basal-body MS-ring/collar protein FliF [Terrilactibacillus tamarindi]MTT32282.1 flagellar basal body M-ring protein FliF [Terrilactibacillus tamarindi]